MSAYLSTLVLAALAGGGLRWPWALAAFSAALWAGALHRRPQWARIPALPLWLAWLGWTLVSTLASPEPWFSLAAYSKTLSAFLVLALAAACDEEDYFPVKWLAVCAALGAAALLLPQAEPMLIGVLFPYYNYTAAVLAAAAAAAAVKAVSEEDARRLWGLILFVLAVLFFLVAARSRGGLAALCAGAAVGFLSRARSSRQALAGGLLMSLLAAAPLWAVKAGNPAAQGRLSIWLAAVQVAQESPLFGEGPGRFAAGFLRHKPPVPESIRITRYPLRATHADNEYLHVAAETGWPALGLLLLALAATLLQAWRNGNAPALAAASALAVQACFMNLWALPALQWLFFFVLGKAGKKPAAAAARSEAWWPAAGACGLVLAALAWWPDWAVRAAREKAQSSVDGAGALAGALALAPESADLYADLARAHLNAGRPGAALDALARAEALNPFDAVLPMMAGDILSRGGRFDGAAVLARRALDIEPRCPHARLLLAEAALAGGRVEEARGHLAQARAEALPEGYAVAPHEGMVLFLDENRAAELERRLAR